MAKYFKNIKNFEDLKNQYKSLLKKNHPDNGGDLEVMKEINVEYDALFPIWKHRIEKETGETVTETAESTRRKFYTEFGWEGSRYDSSLTLKEIAKIVRTYVKEKYPTCKFSVRTSYASMCQELHVEIKEFPEKMYKTGEDLRREGLWDEKKMFKEEAEEMWRKLDRNQLFTLDSWTDEDLIQAYEKAVEKSNFYAIKTEYFDSVLKDVDAFVNSYNYNDSDGRIDYFDVNFYYFGCGWRECKLVPKTARIKNKATRPARKAENKTEADKTEQDTTTEIEQKTGYTYEVNKGEDTRDGSELWVVRIKETLDKAAYIAENKAMKERGGYYSKFKHGFIFRFDPSEILGIA